MDHSSGNNDKELFERVTGFVSEFTAKKAETIRQETSLYHDLGVDGEDAIELLDSFSAEFEVDVRNFPFDDYFGNEGGTSPFNLITRLLKWNTKEYKKSLTIKDLVQAVKSGSLRLG